MASRKCQTCKHYEPSPIWRKGWCRNPRLFSPQQSHLVGQDELGCGFGTGSYWEPAEDVPATGKQFLSLASIRPLRLFPTADELAPSPMVASMSGGGSGGPLAGDTSEQQPRAPRPASSGGGGRPPVNPRQPAGGGRGDGAPPPGQQRRIDFEPTQRYWTDYLRIALPVAGIILMLAVFWIWASNFIDDDDPDPTATVVAVATNTVPAQQPAATTPSEATPVQEQQATTPPEEDDEDPPWEEGDTVLTSGETNLRPSASVEEEAVAVLEAGTELTITGEPETDPEDDERVWYPVEDPDGNSGYVRDDTVESP